MAGKDLASRMREQVTIEAKNLVDNGRGGRKRNPDGPEWITIPNGEDVWAEVIALRGDEALSNGVLRGSQLWKVTMRNRSDVTIQHRLRWGDIVMDIRVAAPSQDRSELVMTCESGVASAT